MTEPYLRASAVREFFRPATTMAAPPRLRTRPAATRSPASNGDGPEAGVVIDRRPTAGVLAGAPKTEGASAGVGLATTAGEPAPPVGVPEADEATPAVAPWEPLELC